MLKGTMNKLKLVAIAVVSLLVLIVVLQNTQAVETNLLFLTVTMPNAALLFGTLIIGFAIGVLTAGHIVSTCEANREYCERSNSRKPRLEAGY